MKVHQLCKILSPKNSVSMQLNYNHQYLFVGSVITGLIMFQCNIIGLHLLMETETWEVAEGDWCTKNMTVTP